MKKCCTHKSNSISCLGIQLISILFSYEKNKPVLRFNRRKGPIFGCNKIEIVFKNEFKIQGICQEDPLENEMATHSSVLVWEIPWTEEPGGLESVGSERVTHDLATEHTHAQDMYQIQMKKNLKFP